jgi:histone-lysine N-methyltransferase ASH1L
MLYECDQTNCNVGKRYCTNRAFQDLAERKAGGGKYRIGVEVIKTSDRGYGVRTNRCFEANQIITEYTGEIITEEECDTRMNEKYKDNAVRTVDSAFARCPNEGLTAKLVLLFDEF